MAVYDLAPQRDTTVDVFSGQHRPVLTVEPGDSITVGSLDAMGQLERPAYPGHAVPMMFPARRGHCLTGPIFVAGARPGDVLAVRLDAVTPQGWGYTVTGGAHTPVTDRVGIAESEPTWLLWDIDESSGLAKSSQGLGRPIAPFLGIVGLAPAGPGEHSTVPPRPGVGGNIDCKELVAGSTLYFPVAVEGALLYLGDGHAAQGDGEAGGTAIESPMVSRITVDLVSPRPLTSLHAETPAGRVCFGFDADLNKAMGDALAEMTTWMQEIYGLDRATALAFTGVAVDLRITQVANQTWGVHALLPTGLLS